MSGTETTVIDEWLIDTLDGLAGITGVYEGLAPNEAVYPFIVFQYMSGSDVFGIGPDARIMVDTEYLVRVVSEADSFADLVSIVDAMDDALDGATGSTTEGVVLSVARREQYREVEQYENQRIRHLGGRYRIIAQGN